MTLLVLALAYIAGVWLGSLLMRAGLLGCDLLDWLWIVPLVLLPLAPLLNSAPREVLARRGIHSHFYDADVVVRDEATQGTVWRRWPYAVRLRLMALLEEMLPEPYAALAEGILLGVDTGIPVELYDRFSATGTGHVLLISGVNSTSIRLRPLQYRRS